MLHDSNRPLRLAFYPSLGPERTGGTHKSLRASIPRGGVGSPPVRLSSLQWSIPHKERILVKQDKTRACGGLRGRPCYGSKFKNIGDVPLTITDAKGSCGCTVPFFAKEPIMPGEESEIHVVYKPGKQEGYQQKTVTITANTQPAETMLRIKAEVLVVDSVSAPSFFALEGEHEQDRMAIEAVNPGCFVIFPNPTSHELRLDLKEHIGRAADVRIHDETGREMLQTHINEINSEASRLDVAPFAPGIYIATVQVEGEAPMSQCFVVDK